MADVLDEVLHGSIRPVTSKAGATTAEALQVAMPPKNATHAAAPGAAFPPSAGEQCRPLRAQVRPVPGATMPGWRTR
jgi:hypothetical protein